MLTSSKTIPEICYIIDNTLTDLVNLKHKFISEESTLTWITNTYDVDDTMSKLQEVSLMLDDPELADKYAYFLKRAKERIESFNDSESHHIKLLEYTEELESLFDELNQNIGLQKVSLTPVAAMIDKICSFIEITCSYWNEDILEYVQEFESMHSNMCVMRHTNIYGQFTYVDPVVQLAYYSFISARVSIHRKYLSGFRSFHYFQHNNATIPSVWDERLYHIYGIMRPDWCYP